MTELIAVLIAIIVIYAVSAYIRAKEWRKVKSGEIVTLLLESKEGMYPFDIFMSINRKDGVFAKRSKEMNLITTEMLLDDLVSQKLISYDYLTGFYRAIVPQVVTQTEQMHQEGLIP